MQESFGFGVNEYLGKAQVGLYTIYWYYHILYGVYGTQKGGWLGGWGVGTILPNSTANSRATALPQCGQCRRAGRMKGRLILAQTIICKTRSCEGQSRRCSRHARRRRAGHAARAVTPFTENEAHDHSNPTTQTVYNTKSTRAHTQRQRELI